MTRDIQRMAIVGTGVMGSGIAQIAAQAGIQVKLFDAREGAAQAEELKDFVTHDLLTERLAFHEKAIWMLRAIVAD